MTHIISDHPDSISQFCVWKWSRFESVTKCVRNARNYVFANILTTSSNLFPNFMYMAEGRNLVFSMNVIQLIIVNLHVDSPLLLENSKLHQDKTSLRGNMQPVFLLVGSHIQPVNAGCILMPSNQP